MDGLTHTKQSLNLLCIVYLNYLLAGYFNAFLSSASYLIKSFRDIIRVSNSLYPVQVRYFVGPDLGPNCLVMVISR